MYQQTNTRAWLILVALLLALVAFPWPEAKAQKAPPVTSFVVSPIAGVVLDSLARYSREHRQEIAGCISDYAVVADTLVVLRVTPAVVTKADSMSVESDGRPFCPAGVPWFHSHVAFYGWPEPSDTDKNTNYLTGTWGVILSVRAQSWRLSIF